MPKKKTINPIIGFKSVLNEILNSQDILCNTDKLKAFFQKEDNKAA